MCDNKARSGQMTTIKETIDAASVTLAGMRPPDFAAALRSFESAAENAVEPFNSLDAKPPEGVDLDKLVRKAMSRGIARAGSSGHGFTLRELRLLAWALWRRVDEKRIAEDAPLLAQYLRTIVSLKKRSHFRALASSYLWHFAPGLPGISTVAKTLQKFLDVAPSKWRERQRRWDVFGPNAPGLMADFFTSADANKQAMADVVKMVGLDGMLVQGGMSRAIYHAALLKYSGNPDIESLRRLTAWRNFASKIGGFCDKEYAEGLLLPWREKGPDEEIKIETRNALLGALGDPRMRISRSNWFGVDKSAQAVILRWLVEVALAQFFRVIDKAAMQGEGGHMWKRRRRFWLAFFKHGALQEAWVAFSGAGMVQLRGSRRDVNYAEIIKGAQYNHAVLLMKVGGLTIADWNLNGKCQIWRRGSKSAPQLYEPRYSTYQLGKGNSTADASFVHRSNGYWRHEVAQHIRDWTGIVVPPQEYL